MIKKKRPFSLALILFAVLSALSVALLLIFLLTSGGAGDGVTTDVPGNDASDNKTLVVISLLSSVTSLVGFVSTTLLGWREEVREARSAALDRQRRELEIEKLKVELERLKGSDAGG